MSNPVLSTNPTPNMDTRRGPRTGNQTWLGLILRSLTCYSWFSYDKMQALHALFTLAPTIRANARSKDDITAACKTHIQFFNTQPYMANFILGICIAMIENHESEEAISAVKVGLMGPLAGIGDSLLWFTIRPILFSIGAGLAIQGNVMGPIIALLAFWAVQFVVRFYGMRIGYEQGTKVIEQFAESGMMEELTNTISIVGVTVVGALIATWVKVTTPLVLKAGEGAGLKFQPILDQLMPKLLPAIFTGLAYYLLTKRKMHPVAVILLFLVVGIALSAAGVL